MGGEGVEAEDAEGEGDDPVGQRGLFEVADVVDAEGDPVVGEEHLAGGVGVGAVGVVEDGRGEEGGEEEDPAQRAMSERERRRRACGMAGARRVTGSGKAAATDIGMVCSKQDSWVKVVRVGVEVCMVASGGGGRKQRSEQRRGQGSFLFGE